MKYYTRTNKTILSLNQHKKLFFLQDTDANTNTKVNHTNNYL